MPSSKRIVLVIAWGLVGALLTAGVLVAQQPVAQSGTWNITNVSGTVSLPTGASTLAEQQTQTTALQIIDDLRKNEDDASANLDPGVVILARRTATPANTSGLDLDYEALQMSAGRLWVDPSGVTLTVASHAVTNVGTFAVQVDGAALTALQLIDDPVVSHDAVDVAPTMGIGLRAIAHGTNPTAVAAADRTVWYANRAGIPFVVGGHPNVVTIEAAYTAAQVNTAIVTVIAGTKIVVTAAGFVCDNANTVDVGFRIGFALVTTPTTTGVFLTHPGVAKGSGYSRGDGGGVLGIGADGEDVRIDAEVPTSGSCRALITYYTIES